MITGTPIIHHYSPEIRTKAKGMIVFRQSDDPYILCKREVDVIYDKVRRLLTTAETWLEYSLDESITNEILRTLCISINKSLAVATREIEELIATHGVTDRADVFEIKDVVTQLQEIADEIFKTYINSNSVEVLC